MINDITRLKHKLHDQAQQAASGNSGSEAQSSGIQGVGFVSFDLFLSFDFFEEEYVREYFFSWGWDFLLVILESKIFMCFLFVSCS